MKILFIVEHYFPYIGGAEILWKNLAESLVKNGNEVTVITTRFKKELKSVEVINGVEVVRLNISNRFAFTFLSTGKCIHYARKADLIHTSSYNAALPAWVASKWTSTKSVITFHEVWGKLWFKMPFTPKINLLAYYCFEWLILKLHFNRVIGVSDSTLKSLIEAGVEQARLSRIYNGLRYEDFEGFQHIPPENTTFCYFGRLGISKGLDILLEGFAVVHQKYPEIKLKLILPTTPSNIFKKIQKTVKEKRIDSGVIWRHDLTREELFEEVTSSSAVVIPSLSEGFCFTAAEAVALKMPIISSEAAALKEVVGGTYIAMDSIDVKGVSNAFERAHHNDWNHKPVKKFPLEDTVNQYIEMYEDIHQGSR